MVISEGNNDEYGLEYASPRLMMRVVMIVSKTLILVKSREWW